MWLQSSHDDIHEHQLSSRSYKSLVKQERAATVSISKVLESSNIDRKY